MKSLGISFFIAIGIGFFSVNAMEEPQIKGKAVVQEEPVKHALTEAELLELRSQQHEALKNTFFRCPHYQGDPEIGAFVPPIFDELFTI